MDAVRDAVGLLTRVPLAVVGDRPGAAAFGLVGAAVGAAGAIPLLLLALGAAEPWLGAVTAIATTTLVTGGIHIDGLADTADALLAPDPHAADRARKDPALGSGGVMAVVLAIGAEVVALASLIGSSGALLSAATFIAVSTVARIVPVVATIAIASRGDAWPGGGLGQGAWFSARVTTGDGAVAVATAVVVTAGLGLGLGPSAAPLALGTLIGLMVGLLAAIRLIGGRSRPDGDAMGATIELSIIAGLVAAAVAA